jgi:uncharacterized protein DUF2066
MHRSGLAILVCLPRRAAWSTARTLTWLLLILAMALAPSHRLSAAEVAEVAEAAAANLFQVMNIKVDETAETAAAARQQALLTGERRAWDALADRLADPQQRRPLPEYAQRDIEDAIKDFWVNEEKASSVRYIATLNYTFQPDRVRRLLSSRGVRYSTTPSPPVAVVPILAPQPGQRLWGGANPWRDAWAGVVTRGLVPLRLAAGEPGDLAVLAPDQALAGDRPGLAEVAKRYASVDTLVTLASIEPAPDPNNRLLKVASTRYAADAATPPQPLPEKVLPVQGSEVTPELWRQAALAIAQDAEIGWRRGGTTVEPRPPGSVLSTTTVRVPTSSIEDWVGMRKRLETVPQVERVRLQSLTREQAVVDIVFPGNFEQLTGALARSGLALRSDNGAWMLSTDLGAEATASEGVVQ